MSASTPTVVLRETHGDEADNRGETANRLNKSNTEEISYPRHVPRDQGSIDTIQH
jgi:hypothetical protein